MPRRRRIAASTTPAIKCRGPAMANGGMLSMATRVARNVVPHDTHTASQAQYARRSCLGDESNAGLNGTTTLQERAVRLTMELTRPEL